MNNVLSPLGAEICDTGCERTWVLFSGCMQPSGERPQATQNSSIRVREALEETHRVLWVFKVGRDGKPTWKRWHLRCALENREWIFQEDETEWRKAPAQVNMASRHMGHWRLELGEGITSVLMRKVRILLHRNYSLWTPKCEHRGTTQIAGSISALLCGHWAAVTQEQKCTKGQMQTEGVKRHLPLLTHLRPTWGKQKTTLSLTSLAPLK